eukprot:745455-Rhodomonas_salina.2
MSRGCPQGTHKVLYVLGLRFLPLLPWTARSDSCTSHVLRKHTMACPERCTPRAGADGLEERAVCRGGGEEGRAAAARNDRAAPRLCDTADPARARPVRRRHPRPQAHHHRRRTARHKVRFAAAAEEG